MKKKVTSPPRLACPLRRQGRPPSEAKRGKESIKKGKGRRETAFWPLLHLLLGLARTPPLPPLPPKAERRNEHGCSFSRARKIPLPSPPLLSLFPPLRPPLRYPAGDASVTNPSLPRLASGATSLFPDSLCRRRHRLSLPSLQRSPERDTTQRKEALSPPPFLPLPQLSLSPPPPSPYPSYSADERRPPEGRTDGKRPRKE